MCWMNHLEVEELSAEYLHINYKPSGGWVLSIMARLLNSPDKRLRSAFDEWSETPLKELGFAITTRMYMLGRCIQRLNVSIDELRKELTADPSQLNSCLANRYAFMLRDDDLAYELLLEMDSFLFESRSLYEVMGKFLRTLFHVLFARTVSEAELLSILSTAGIGLEWVEELRENRKFFFHETAPWLAVKRENGVFNPVLLKRNTVTFDSSDVIDFEILRNIYDGFIKSANELHRYTVEQIRLYEFKSHGHC
jgi:hypothetical protein